MHLQKRDFLETVGKTLVKNSEEVHPEDVETYLQIEVTRSPEFIEEIYKACRLYKRLNKIRNYILDKVIHYM